jgi:hypothetical protein
MGAVHAQPHVVDFGLPLVNGELHLRPGARRQCCGSPQAACKPADSKAPAQLFTITSSMLYGPVIGLVVSLPVPLNSHSDRSDNSAEKAVSEHPMLSIEPRRISVLLQDPPEFYR